MTTLYTEFGKVELSSDFDSRSGSAGKGLERVVEQAVSEAKQELTPLFTENAATLCEELHLDFASKRSEIEKAIESYLDENVTADCFYIGQDEARDFFDTEILRRIFQVQLEEFPMCEECEGLGKCYNNADPTSGQFHWCEVCKGSGVIESLTGLNSTQDK